MALKAEEINLLVYRYLQESGHLHSAFTFAYESLVTQSEIAKMYADTMPPGALISIIQKGLMYLKVEENLDADISKCSTDPTCCIDSSKELSILSATVLQGITKSKSIKYSKWYVKHDKNRNEDEDEEVEKAESRTIGKRKRIGICVAPNATQSIDFSKKHTSEMEGSAIPEIHSTESTSFPKIQSTGMTEEQAISSADVLILTGHEAEVFCCSWHPRDGLLASGSGDSTVRLWNLPDDKTTANLKIKSPLPRVLECIAPMQQEKKSTSAGDDHDVTTLEWSVDGSLLATGCMDGIARLWSREGVLQHSLNAHSESIFSLRFDSAGKRLLTGSYDKCVSVWDVRTGKLQHKFEAHSAQVLDVDWKTGGYHGLDVFASCSTDRTIAVCALADREADTDPAAATTTPLQVLVGHADEVNAIRWDPSGGLLASCSDDHQVLIWQLGQSLAQSMIDRQSFYHLPLLRSVPVHRFSNHTEEIYTIRWSPTGQTTNMPNAPLRLASASFDATVRLWDTDMGVCLHTLRNHTKKVYTIAFSPDGRLLASGSLGGQLNIWSVPNGKLLKTYNQGGADIFEVAWNANGTRLAATSTNAVTLIDVRVI